MPTARRPIPTALLLLSSIAATFAVFEAAARWTLRGDPGTLFVAASVEPDPGRGWRHRPGATGSYGHGDWAINRAEAKDSGRPVYHPGGGHWNEAGHAVAAREIRRAVKSAGGLRCDDRPTGPRPVADRDAR